MSFFEIGIFNGKYSENVGTLWRTAYQLGASGIFTVAYRYSRQPSDTVKAYRHIPLRNFETVQDFLGGVPEDAKIVCVEMGGTPLKEFKHPKQAIYLLGAEDSGIDKDLLDVSDHVISIEAVRQESFNVAVAGAIIMYHRLINQQNGD